MKKIFGIIGIVAVFIGTTVVFKKCQEVTL